MGSLEIPVHLQSRSFLRTRRTMGSIVRQYSGRSGESFRSRDQLVTASNRSFFSQDIRLAAQSTNVRDTDGSRS